MYMWNHVAHKGDFIETIYKVLMVPAGGGTQPDTVESKFFMSVVGYAGLAVAQLVEVLCYRLEGHGFDS
jgi:hypothetical protein